MPREKIALRYHEQVARLAERGLKSPTIEKMIRREAEAAGFDDAPSERSVRRIYNEHVGKSPEDRRQYVTFQWPDFMREAELPWQASEIILDWIRTFDANLVTRPTISRAKWYWRVHIAAPDLGDGFKSVAARWLSQRELKKDEMTEALSQIVESYLIHKPWTWPNDQDVSHLVLILLRSLGLPDKLEPEQGPPHTLGNLWSLSEIVLKYKGLIPANFDPDHLVNY